MIDGTVVAGQTVEGRLLDAETGGAVAYARVAMLTELGDSVGSTLSDRDGRFSVSAASPGAYLIAATGFGYRRSLAGVFELGERGVITIDFALPPVPLPIDEILVELDRPTLSHPLVSNGFVERLRGGLGIFITPAELEESSATTTADLFLGINGLRVARYRATGSNASSVGTGDLSYLGDVVQMRGTEGWCTPTVFLDGVKTRYGSDQGGSLENVVPLHEIDAVEVYRRPAEIPLQFAVTQSRGGEGGICGVLLFWTRRR